MQGHDFEHEQVQIMHDRDTGLTAIIALHSTVLGPAAGGVRRWSYTGMAAAQQDALRLSEGMTYKNALAGLPFGGGKSVILADHNQKPTPAQLKKFAQWLNELEGKYVTAEDVGMGVPEMCALAAHTTYVSGLGTDGFGGDPSPKTAHGVFLGIQAAVKHKLGLTSMLGVRVAVQGLGNVGMNLCRTLSRVGAQLWVADIDPNRVTHAEKNFGATGVAPNALLKLAVDVFAPCALGGAVTEEIAESIDTAVIAGAANNQLAEEICGDILAQRKILYAPDFIINAGGVISVAHEYLMQDRQMEHASDQGAEHFAEQWVEQRIESIPERLLSVVRNAEQLGGSTQRVAREQALDVLAAGYRLTGGCKAA